MNPSSEPRPESLIAEQDWVRPLVQRLVRDEASAADVLQSTWLREMRHPPRAERGSPSWRAWFVRVARNLAARDGQRASARRERELRAARGEQLPSMHEIAEREELRAKIVAHVLALPEPYRSTLVLRYYEGLEPRAIARAQGVNGSTARNRIARGLGLLRERMERERGKDWISSCLAVLPLGSAELLVAHAGWVAWIAKGGIAVKKIEFAAAAALTVTASAMWFAWPSKSGSGTNGQQGKQPSALSSEGSGLALPKPSGTGESTLDSGDAGSAARRAAEQRQPADPAAVAAVGAGVRVYGQVRDARGELLEDKQVRYRILSESAPPTPDVPLLHSTVEGQALVVQDLNAETELRLEEKRAQEQATASLERVRERLDTINQKSREVLVAQGLSALERQDEAYTRLALSGVLSRLGRRGITRIVLADSEGCQFTAETDAEGAYSAEGLHAGKWRVIATCDGKLCRRQELEIAVNERQHKLDLVLDDALDVRIRLRTPDGRELTEAIANDPELAGRVALSPVALRPGSAARFLPDGENQDFGCGSYASREQFDAKERAGIGEASGVLTITEAPPLDVGLVMCGQLIARQPLAPGQEEVDFTLSLEELRRQFATVVVHVVDAQTHAPIVGASVTIDGVVAQVEATEGSFIAEDDERARLDAAQVPKTDALGVVRIPWVLAGKHRLYAMAQGYSAFTARVDTEAGGICELKPVELTGHARISGRLVFASGDPAQYSFQLVPLDRFEETRESLAAVVWSSNQLGLFEITQQRRERYVLRVVEGDSRLPPVVIDATQGDVRDLELTLLPAVQVQLVFTREPTEGAELRISTAAGLPVLEVDLEGLAPSELHLAAGAYVAEVREGARKAGSVRFVVAKDPLLRVVLPLD